VKTIHQKCPFCGGKMTPIYNGNLKRHIIHSWECNRKSCQFHSEYFGGDGLEHRNMKVINKMQARIETLKKENEALENKISDLRLSSSLDREAFTVMQQGM